MENIIVFGKGNYYLQRKTLLLKHFHIIAFVDNAVSVSEAALYTEDGIPLLHPSLVTQLDPCRIIIMSKHFISIWKQLLQYEIPEERIIFGCTFPPYDLHDIYSKSTRLFSSGGSLIYEDENGSTFTFSDAASYKALQQKTLRRKFDYSQLIDAMPLHPGSTIFGLDRGMPIDRYYIEQFLQENRQYITGDVLEIAENTYTEQFGSHVNNSYILHVEGGDGNIIKGNFETGEGIDPRMVDCIICTQTLPFLYDLPSAARNIVTMLKPGGTALLTVSGITQISRYDMERWGHFWSFTDASLSRLFQQEVPLENITTKTYGNVKTAAAFLYGLSVEDLPQDVFSYQDPDYQMLITAIIRR